MKIHNIVLGAVAALALMGASSAIAQTSTGKVTAAAPTYTTNTAAPLSLDTAGNLRVVNGGSPSGTQNVNVIAVGGNAVTTTVPISGAVTTTGTVTSNDQNGPAQSGADGVSNTNNTAQVVDSTGTGRPGWRVFPMLWNGTTWDRAPGTTALGMSVNCVSGCVAGSGVSQGAATTAAPTYTTGTNNPLSLDLAGNLRVLVGNSSIAVTQSGTWNIGTVTAVTSITNPVAVTGTFWQATQPVSGTFWQATQPVSGTVAATQSGAWNTGQMPLAATATVNYSLIAANTTNATSVVAGAHALFEVSVYNNSATIAYLKLYDSGSAPTCGSGTPVARYLIPGATAGGAGSNIPLPFGKAFASGIAFCITTGIADADTAAPAASAYLVNLTYK